jgi:hypothetical protein
MMNTTETLHSLVDNLPEDSRMELLDYILLHYDQYLLLQTETEKQAQQTLLEQLLLKRYQRYQANPETIISAEESLQKTRLKYGW